MSKQKIYDYKEAKVGMKIGSARTTAIIIEMIDTLPIGLVYKHLLESFNESEEITCDENLSRRLKMSLYPER